MINAEEIRFLPYYLIPPDWNIHLIDRRTNEQQLEQIQRIIEDAQLFAFDTETMPSFYHPNFQQNHSNRWRLDSWHSAPSQPQQNSCISKPSLLQVAVRNQTRTSKQVLLFDLQELFDRSSRHFRECPTAPLAHRFVQSIFSHPTASKLSQSIFNDLAHLKCSYDEDCFHRSTLTHLVELSDIYRKAFPTEKEQQIYSLQRMTATALHCQLDKKQQCANWSKRPLMQSLKDYAAMDVIVMIDIYDRLKTKLSQEAQPSIWEDFKQSIETSLNLNEIVLYQCVCGERFITNKTRNKHARTCPKEQQRLEQEATARSEQSCTVHNKTKNLPTTDDSSLPQLELGAPIPCGRGYLPPALKRAYQSMNQIPFYEQVRCSSSFDQLHRFTENRPPDAQFFLDDDDTEVAQAFGLQTNRHPSKPKLGNRSNHLTSHISSVPTVKQHLKIAAYPPKTNSASSSSRGRLLDENELLDRLRDDFDSQPEFHCHLFGLGGRGRASSGGLPPPEPSITRLNNCN